MNSMSNYYDNQLHKKYQPYQQQNQQIKSSNQNMNVNYIYYIIITQYKYNIYYI